MIIKKLQITSASTLDLDLNVTTPVCIIRGKHSSLALDLVREIIGDDRAENDPNRFEDGRFVICSDIEIDGKDYCNLLGLHYSIHSFHQKKPLECRA